MPKPFSWPSDWPWPPLLKSQAPEWSPSVAVAPSALSIALYVILGISILVILVTLFVFWRSHNHTSKRMTWRHSNKDSKIPLKQSSEISVTLHINESEVEFLKCTADPDSPFSKDDESTEFQAPERVRRHSLPHRLPMFVNDVFILPSPPRSIALNELRIVNGSVIGTPGFAATEVAKSQNLSALSLVLQGD
ncbi:hypothetical protein HDU77_000056 [Chytriomyces hyalinus]|nr:hypothetical protein HDU77_000056 [Chytriomyces hyalinus]